MNISLDGSLPFENASALAFLLGRYLEEALALSITSVFKRDQVLFYENHWPQGLYIADPEKINFLPGDAKTDQHEDKFDLGGFVVLGLDALLKREPYRLRAVAAADTNIYFVPKAAFFPWINRLMERDGRKS